MSKHNIWQILFEYLPWLLYPATMKASDLIYSYLHKLGVINTIEARWSGQGNTITEYLRWGVGRITVERLYWQRLCFRRITDKKLSGWEPFQRLLYYEYRTWYNASSTFLYRRQKHSLSICCLWQSLPVFACRNTVYPYLEILIWLQQAI